MTDTLTGWLVDVSHSSAAFTVRNLAVHTVSGRVPIQEAVVEVDGEGRPAAVRAVLDLTGIDTGNRRRDRDLAAPRLLDTARWPILGFTGPVESAGPGRWRVHGTLTAHGTATDVVLDIEATQASSSAT
jgi:polyisoprenoid-binding protein YceI